MATLSLRLSDNQKRMIKMMASYHGKTITEFILEATGVKNKKDGAKKRGNIHKAIQDLKNGNSFHYDTLEAFIEDSQKW